MLIIFECSGNLSLRSEDRRALNPCRSVFPPVTRMLEKQSLINSCGKSCVALAIIPGRSSEAYIISGANTSSELSCISEYSLLPPPPDTPPPRLRLLCDLTLKVSGRWKFDLVSSLTRFKESRHFSFTSAVSRLDTVAVGPS